MTRVLLISISIFTIFSCNNVSVSTEKAPNKELATLLSTYWAEADAYDSFGSTSKGNTAFNGVLNNNITIAFNAKSDSFSTAYYNRLSKIDRESLNENDRISYDIFKKNHETSLEGRQFNFDEQPIQQFWGTALTFMQYGSGESDQPFKTVLDYNNFLSRTKDFSIWADTAIANMRKGMLTGNVLPKALAIKVVPQMLEHTGSDATKSLFYGPIKKLPATFTAAEKTKITADYINSINTVIKPTFQKLATFFQKEYIPKTRLSSGIGAIPNGKKQYEYLVRDWTTTNMTPDEIHNLGLSEVARIRAEMEKIKSEVGFKGDLKAFFTYTINDTKFKIFKTPKDVLDGFHKIHTTMEPQLKKYFNNLPKSKFEIRQTEKFREATASAEYSQGTADGKRPGIFYTPILDAKNFVYPGMESLFLHEAIPGHHYQSSLQIENKDIPDFRKYYWNGAYGEGWALYCESLGKELGLYTNPYHYFGALGDEMHRAIRLVVDTGIHAKGWSREKALQYSLDNEPTSLQAATAEIERYMAIPGQALSYKIGALKIRALRTKYEKDLGPKFDIAKFHDKVLAFGNLPLDILENVMDNWAKSQK
jgi:uncharacterized protein (DUF885 family)